MYKINKNASPTRTDLLITVLTPSSVMPMILSEYLRLVVFRTGTLTKVTVPSEPMHASIIIHVQVTVKLWPHMHMHLRIFVSFHAACMHACLCLVSASSPLSGNHMHIQ